MVAAPAQELTLILGRARAGDLGAKNELIAMIYDELRQVASRADAAGADRAHAFAHRGCP